MAEPTYIFKDGHVYTMVDGEVTSKVKEAEFSPQAIPGEVEMPEVPVDLEGTACPTCGQHTQPQDSFCPNCGTPLSEDPTHAELNGELPDDGTTDPSVYGPPGSGNVGGSMVAQTVTTPNGLKGRVLARVPDIWGEQVTVRFENGVIKQIPVDKSMTFAAAEETPEGVPATKRLEDRLAKTFSTDKNSLIERGKELDTSRAEARAAIADASDAEAAELDKIYVQAGFEQNEIVEALDHIESTRAYEPPAPIESVPTVEQAHTGGADGSWLDGVLNTMTAEANATDYEKLMDEGPEAFVAQLSAAQMADSGTTRAMAQREIRSHTAGADERTQDAYEKVWLARVESQRKEQLKNFKEEVRKEAASEEISHPDESLFL